MANPGASKDGQTVHVESTVEDAQQRGDGAAISPASILTLNADEIRDQIAAQVRETKLSRRSKVAVQLYIILFLAYCNSWGTGFDSSLMSSMNANDRFHSDLGIPKTGGYLGIVTAIYTVGNIVGSFFAGPASDRFGRRIGMFTGATFALMGAIVVFTAKHGSAYMAGRFFIGFGVSISRSAAPSFVTEISPPQWRGPATLLYNSLWIIGAILSSGIAYATGPLKSDLSWRLPLILQILPWGIVLLTCLFLPESPRWLIANDRFEEAEAILTKYHANGKANSPLVALEIAEMRESIKQEASDKRWYDYSELISSRPYRYRTFLVASMGFIGQMGGSNLTGYYQANILRSVGVISQKQLLAYNLCYYVACLGGATIGSLICDRVGRRKLLIAGSLGMSACLIILAGIISHYHNTQPASLSRFTVAVLFFIGIFHSGGINPLVVAYPVECLHTNTRAKGMGLNNLVLNISEFTNAYGGPVGLAKIGWRMFIIYGIWDIVQVAWIYFAFVETRGHTLEELDVIFEAKNPVKASLEKRREVEAISGDQVKAVV